jgi:hypothetical protein
MEGHECWVCGKKFSQAENRDRHIKTIHDLGDLPFKCENCGKMFSRKDHHDRYLTTHIEDVGRRLLSRVPSLARFKPRTIKKRPLDVKCVVVCSPKTGTYAHTFEVCMIDRSPSNVMNAERSTERRGTSEGTWKLSTTCWRDYEKCKMNVRGIAKREKFELGFHIWAIEKYRIHFALSPTSSATKKNVTQLSVHPLLNVRGYPLGSLPGFARMRLTTSPSLEVAVKPLRGEKNMRKNCAKMSKIGR